jgi:hypothetical protein
VLQPSIAATRLLQTSPCRNNAAFTRWQTGTDRFKNFCHLVRPHTAAAAAATATAARFPLRRATEPSEG